MTNNNINPEQPRATPSNPKQNPSDSEQHCLRYRLPGAPFYSKAGYTCAYAGPVNFTDLFPHLI